MNFGPSVFYLISSYLFWIITAKHMVTIRVLSTCKLIKFSSRFCLQCIVYRLSQTMVYDMQQKLNTYIRECFFRWTTILLQSDYSADSSSLTVCQRVFDLFTYSSNNACTEANIPRMTLAWLTSSHDLVFSYSQFLNIMRVKNETKACRKTQITIFLLNSWIPTLSKWLTRGVGISSALLLFICLRSLRSMTPCFFLAKCYIF